MYLVRQLGHFIPESGEQNNRHHAIYKHYIDPRHMTVSKPVCVRLFRVCLTALSHNRVFNNTISTSQSRHGAVTKSDSLGDFVDTDTSG